MKHLMILIVIVQCSLIKEADFCLTLLILKNDVIIISLFLELTFRLSQTKSYK